MHFSLKKETKIFFFIRLYYWFITNMDSEGRRVVVCDNGTGVSFTSNYFLDDNST